MGATFQVELGGDKLNLKKDGEFQKWKALEAIAKEEVLRKAVVDGKRLSDNIGPLDLLLMRIILLPLGECPCVRAAASALADWGGHSRLR